MTMMSVNDEVSFCHCGTTVGDGQFSLHRGSPEKRR
jgi:hypothetical protein